MLFANHSKAQEDVIDAFFQCSWRGKEPRTALRYPYKVELEVSGWSFEEEGWFKKQRVLKKAVNPVGLYSGKMRATCGGNLVLKDNDKLRCEAWAGTAFYKCEDYAFRTIAASITAQKNTSQPAVNAPQEVVDKTQPDKVENEKSLEQKLTDLEARPRQHFLFAQDLWQTHPLDGNRALVSSSLKLEVKFIISKNYSAFAASQEDITWVLERIYWPHLGTALMRTFVGLKTFPKV